MRVTAPAALCACTPLTALLTECVLHPALDSVISTLNTCYATEWSQHLTNALAAALLRPALKLALQARAFPGTPVLALTATATDKVKADVLKLLGMRRDCRTFQARPYMWLLCASLPTTPLVIDAEVTLSSLSRRNRHVQRIEDSRMSW